MKDRILSRRPIQSSQGEELPERRLRWGDTRCVGKFFKLKFAFKKYKRKNVILLLASKFEFNYRIIWRIFLFTSFIFEFSQATTPPEPKNRRNKGEGGGGKGVEAKKELAADGGDDEDVRIIGTKSARVKTPRGRTPAQQKVR